MRNGIALELAIVAGSLNEMHGTPWLGSRVIVLTRQQANGWKSDFTDTSAIIPAKTGLAARRRGR